MKFLLHADIKHVLNYAKAWATEDFLEKEIS